MWLRAVKEPSAPAWSPKRNPQQQHKQARLIGDSNYFYVAKHFICLNNFTRRPSPHERRASESYSQDTATGTAPTWPSTSARWTSLRAEDLPSYTLPRGRTFLITQINEGGTMTPTRCIFGPRGTGDPSPCNFEGAQGLPERGAWDGAWVWAWFLPILHRFPMENG